MEFIDEIDSVVGLVRVRLADVLVKTFTTTAETSRTWNRTGADGHQRACNLSPLFMLPFLS